MLLAIGGGGYLWYRSQTASRVNVVPLAQLPKAERQKRRSQAQKVVSEVETIARAAKRGEKKPFELTVSQDDLNTLIQDRLKTKNLPLENPRIGLQNGQLIMEADGKYKGVSGPVSLVGTVKAENGDMSFHVDSLTIVVVSAPREWKEKVQSAVDEGLKKALREKGTTRIDTVTIGDGTLTIRGQTA